ncbi:MAG: hypothetical protein WA947_02920 [Phormidesmis sp.]
MDLTDNASSISDTIASTVTDRRWPVSSVKASPTLEWKLADANDVTIASRHCVETIVAQRIGLPLDEQNGDGYEAACETDCEKDPERNRFTLTQLYSQKKVVVDVHLFDPTDSCERSQLQQYARSLQDLDSAAIPTYVDAFELETPLGPGFAIVQAVAEAKSIQQWIADGYCFDEFELRLIALRVLYTLKYLHAQAGESAGCKLHRAIKPSNILLEDRRTADPFADYEPTRDRRSKVKAGRGFGRLYLVNLARAAVESASGTLTLEGTYGYTAPEQFYGRAQPASDLYSLGATLIYMASGKPPSTWMGADLAIQPQNIALSRSFVEWISQLTHADLAKRTTSANDALQELELIQILGKPLAKGDYNLAVPSAKLSRQPQTAYLDFKVNLTHQELKIRLNYDRIAGDKTQGRAAPAGMVSPEELKTALLLVVAVTLIGSTVALTGSALLGFVVALLLPGFYFLMFPYVPAADESLDRQASIRIRRDSFGRMFITLATTPLPNHESTRRNRAQTAFIESRIHFANVPVRLLCTKPGFFSSKISFILATNDPKRTEKVAILGSQEEIRWLRVHVGRWLKS